MGNDPQKARPSAFENEQVRFGVLLAVVAAGLIAVLLLGRTKELDVGGARGRIEHKLEDRHRRRQTQALRAACKRNDCTCLESAARAGLDVDSGREVLELLGRATECRFGALAGIRAEATVRAGSSAEGQRLAGEILTKDARDAHALTALGLAAYQAGAIPVARDLLERALDAGASDGARLLLGLTRYQASDLAGARAAFEAILANEPADVDAMYDLALVAQKQDRYGEARRLYLSLLRAKPEHRQARYNLAILAHSIGAEQEAQHHQALLEKAAPGDPLLAALRAELAKPSTRKGQILTLGGTKPVSSAR
jgi:tetratricopeptide (TPR) repeat protein